MAIVLLAIQLPWSATVVTAAVRGGPPLSRSADLGALIAGRPELHDAILVADPDYFLEALPYYGVANPLYLTREQRFGTFVRFTTHARRYIAAGRRLGDGTGAAPVDVAAGSHRAGRTARPRAAADARRGLQLGVGVDTRPRSGDFLAATTLVARLRPAAGDESYDVYTLDR